MTKHRPIAAKKHPPAKHDGRVTHKTTAAGVSRLPLVDYRENAETLAVHSAAVLAALLAGLALTAALLLTRLLVALLLVTPRVVLLLVRHGKLSSDFVGLPHIAVLPGPPDNAQKRPRFPSGV